MEIDWIWYIYGILGTFAISVLILAIIDNRLRTHQAQKKRKASIYNF